MTRRYPFSHRFTHVRLKSNPPARLRRAVETHGLASRSAIIVLIWLLTGALSMAFAITITATESARADDLIADEKPGLPIAINLGATAAYTSIDGTTFLPDQAWRPGSYGYVDGAKDDLRPSFPIAGTDDPTLYLTRLKQWTTYRIDEIPMGQYVVVLHFAEISAQGSGQTVFDVSIEGTPILEGLDLFEQAGLGRADVRRFLTEVNDGSLDIVAQAGVGSTHMAAIEIIPVAATDVRPEAPQNSRVTPSFNANILTWTASSDPAIGGYHIYRSPNLDGPFIRISDQPVRGSAYVDTFLDLPANVPPSFDLWHYQLAAVDLFDNESERTPTVLARPLDPEDAAFPVYEIEISGSNLALLQSDVRSNVEVPALVTHEGRRYPAEVRFRGHVGRFYPKKSWKIIFPNQSPVEPRDRLNLRAQYEDPSLLRGALAYWLYDEAGIRPPTSVPALLFVNGTYAGLYDDAEEVDRAFLQRTQRNADASIYAAKWTPYGNWGSLLDSVDEYHAAFTKKTNSGSGYGDLISFFEMINHNDERSIAGQLTARLDVTRFLDYYAVIVLTQNMDFTRHNVFLIHDLDRDRWEISPWDPDYTWGVVDGFSPKRDHDKPVDMGTFQSPVAFNGPNVLLSRVLSIPQFKAYYCTRVQQLAEESLSELEFEPIVDGLYAEIQEAARGDWHKFGWEESDRFDAEPNRIKSWAGKRRAFILDEIPRFCDARGPFLTINEVMPDNATALCDPDDPDPSDCHEPWIEIYNAGLETVSLQGFHLKIASQEGAPFRIDHPIQVPPLGHAIVWLDGEPAQGRNHLSLRMPAAAGAVSLYSADGQTLIDTLSYELPPPDRSWGRFPDGAQESSLLSLASPGSRNRSGPYVGITEPADPYAPADSPIHITAEIGDDGYVTSAQLSYSVNDGPWQSLPMMRTRYGRYEAEIPGQPPGSLVNYAIETADDEGIRSRSPSADPNDVHIVIVGYERPSVRISRFSAPLIADDEERTESWIELHNYGDDAISLAGMYLSNEPDDSTRFLIAADIMLEADSRVVFITDGNPEAGPTHTNFTLDPEGGSVALFDANIRVNRLIDLHRYGDEITGEGAYACPSANATWIASTPGVPADDDSEVCHSIYLPQIR